MSRLAMHAMIGFGLFGLAGTLALPPEARAASDPRFFGTYCGSYREPQTLVFPCFPLLPWILCSRTENLDLSVRVQTDYHETDGGQGFVTGAGSAEVVGDVPATMSDSVHVGDRIPFVISGRVTARGQLDGAARTLGAAATEGSVILSNDGLSITVNGFDRTLTLRKDLCGNTPPAAFIRRPEGDHFAWHEVLQLAGAATDPDDASFPDERLVWTSSLDARLGTGASLWKNDLSPGRHTITFTVTDSGGLIASERREITIENHIPQATIDQPVAGGVFYDGVGIVLRGRGFDRETGNLTGRALVWTTAGGGLLGIGNQLLATLPAGVHTIRLTASDGDLAGRAEVTLRVQARPAGNAPPAITITAPPDRSAPVSDRPDDCVTLTASAFDLEDGPLTGDAITWTDEMAGGAVIRTLERRGASIEACSWVSTGGDTWHTVTATVTDSGGARAGDSIRILVISGGLI